MSDIDTWADSLNRTAKIAMDTGEASSPVEALRIFRGYRLRIVVGPDVAQSAVKQAALLTAVNCAARTFLGGVTVLGASGDLRLTLPPYRDVAEAVVGLGGVHTFGADDATPTLVIGDAKGVPMEPLAIRATFDGWKSGACPANRASARLAETGDFIPAGVAAGAIAVGEAFQRLREFAAACRRATGMNLWRPEQDWRTGESGPPLSRLPAALWLVGLGNLGQSYLWTLGLLPYGKGSLSLMLQDLDFIAPSNLSTSLLTTERMMRRHKTRAMADWAESRGFNTAIVEREFRADFQVGDLEPKTALIGVDNALARQSIERVGFDCVVEAGLGKGPQDYLGIDVHTFPASKPAADVWNVAAEGDVDIAQPAYRAMLEASGDRCGVVRLAERSIAAPFVGALAGAMVTSEVIRLASAEHRYEIVSCHMRDLAIRNAAVGEPRAPAVVGAVTPSSEVAQST